MSRSESDVAHDSGALIQEFSAFFENFGVRGTIAQVWTTLYLSPVPLGQREIGDLTGLSTGMVSTALQQLEAWEAVRVARVPGSRRLHYEPETNLLKALRRILRARDLEAVQRLRQAVGVALQTYDPPVGGERIKERLRNVAQAADVYSSLFQAIERVALLPSLVPGVVRVLRGLAGERTVPER